MAKTGGVAMFIYMTWHKHAQYLLKTKFNVKDHRANGFAYIRDVLGMLRIATNEDAGIFANCHAMGCKDDN